MTSSHDLGAVILCGGKSRRMGRPKLWLPFGDGEVLLQRVVRLASEAVGPIVVVAAPEQDLPALPPSVVVVRDAVADRGPLQGLFAGLSALPESIEFAYATATDVPFLEPRWISFLRARIETSNLAIPCVDGFYQPLSALYRRSTCLSAIVRLIEEGRMRPVFLVDLVRTTILSPEDLKTVDPGLRTLRNLNTYDDYLSALEEVESR